MENYFNRLATIITIPHRRRNQVSLKDVFSCRPFATPLYYNLIIQIKYKKGGKLANNELPTPEA